MTRRVGDLEVQRRLSEEMRYLRKLRRALQATDERRPGAEGLDRLNRELDQLPRPGWLARWRS